MKFTHLREKFPLWRAKLQGDKKLLLLVVGGVLVVLLLLLSEWSGTTDKPQQEPAETDYAATLEEKLGTMIASIDGAGKARVLVTLKSGNEAVYARNDRMDTDSTRTQSEQEYVLVGSGSGETGLRLKTVTPQVLGVAVVCEGADVPQVRQAITETVTAALGIGSTHVSVVRMQTERK